jgi:hypothetical protein
MATTLLTIPRGLLIREIELNGLEAGSGATRQPKRFKPVVLYPKSLGEVDEGKFMQQASSVHIDQWSPAWRSCTRKEHDIQWGEWWGLWRYRFFKYGNNGTGPIECVVVVLAGVIQGMMLVGPSKPANLGSAVTERLLYLAHMATAPWNRKVYWPKSGIYPETLRGIGSALVKEAIRLSACYGYRGRIGLNAMGRSAGFYRKLGMQRVQNPKDKDFRDPWFEFSEQAAQDFLDKFTS